MVPPTRSTPSLKPPSPRAYLRPARVTTQPAANSRTRHRAMRRVNGFMVMGVLTLRSPAPRRALRAFLGVLLRVLDDAGDAAAQHPHLHVRVFVDLEEEFVLEVLAVRLNDLVHGADEGVVDDDLVALLDRGDQLQPVAAVA